MTYSLRIQIPLLLLAGAAAVGVAIAAKPGQPPTREEIRTIPEHAEGWLAMDRLLRAARSPDRALAVDATTRAARIAHNLDLDATEVYEISRAERVTQRNAWLALATQRGRWLDLRVAALEIALTVDTTLADAERLAETAWLPLASDPEPEMRLAAVTAIPYSDELRARLKTITLEASEELAVAAAARYCRDAESARIASASAKLHERIEKLAAALALPIANRGDLVRCLALSGRPTSRKAIRAVLSQSPPALRRALLEVAAPKAPSPPPALPQ